MSCPSVKSLDFMLEKLHSCWSARAIFLNELTDQQDMQQDMLFYITKQKLKFYRYKVWDKSKTWFAVGAKISRPLLLGFLALNAHPIAQFRSPILFCIKHLFVCLQMQWSRPNRTKWQDLFMPFRGRQKCWWSHLLWQECHTWANSRCTSC